MSIEHHKSLMSMMSEFSPSDVAIRAPRRGLQVLIRNVCFVQPAQSKSGTLTTKFSSNSVKWASEATPHLLSQQKDCLSATQQRANPVRSHDALAEVQTRDGRTWCGAPIKWQSQKFQAQDLLG
ncbi:hypothetical protein BN2476_740099 [Paraburkholderia piptadeniae]|uniref:Uncharacterized protein n=1 Tax=Paraburkholderia piptadeniae TaxID=1701573 RepID=A0A1N7SRS0_9BURK|nr:hypothetical protein BN2476_740099 [Paraburkholderia piptadeniae]